MTRSARGLGGLRALVFEERKGGWHRSGHLRGFDAGKAISEGCRRLLPVYPNTEHSAPGPTRPTAVPYPKRTRQSEDGRQVVRQRQASARGNLASPQRPCGVPYCTVVHFDDGYTVPRPGNLTPWSSNVRQSCPPPPRPELPDCILVRPTASISSEISGQITIPPHSNTFESKSLVLAFA